MVQDWAVEPAMGRRGSRSSHIGPFPDSNGKIVSPGADGRMSSLGVQVEPAVEG